MKIAILGYGVVGSGAYEILTKSGFEYIDDVCNGGCH